MGIGQTGERCDRRSPPRASSLPTTGQLSGPYRGAAGRALSAFHGRVTCSQTSSASTCTLARATATNGSAPRSRARLRQPLRWNRLIGNRAKADGIRVGAPPWGRDVAVKVLHHRLVVTCLRSSFAGSAALGSGAPHLGPLETGGSPTGLVSRAICGAAASARSRNGGPLARSDERPLPRSPLRLAFAHPRFAPGNVGRRTSFRFQGNAISVTPARRPRACKNRDDLEQLDAMPDGCRGRSRLLGWLEAGDGASGAAALVEACSPAAVPVRRSRNGRPNPTRPAAFGEADPAPFRSRESSTMVAR